MDQSPNYDDLLKFLELNVISDLSESSLKLRSVEWSMQQEVLNAEKKKAEAMKTRSDLLTKLSVMMNTSAKLKTEETKNAKRLQASFKEMDHLEEKARVQSDKMGEWYVQFNYDLQKLKAMSENEMKDLEIELETMAALANQYEKCLTAHDSEIDALQGVVQEKNVGLEAGRKKHFQVLSKIRNVMEKNILDGKMNKPNKH